MHMLAASDAHRMEAVGDRRDDVRGRCKQCCTHRKMTLIAAALTAVMSVATCGIIITELMNLGLYGRWAPPESDHWQKHNRYTTYVPRDENPYYYWYLKHQYNDSSADSVTLDDMQWQLNVARILYTALACLYVLMTISSISLVKGLVQGRPSLIATWSCIVLATILYEAGVLGRDWYMLGVIHWLVVKLSVYFIFVLMQAVCIRSVLISFQEARVKARNRARRQQRVAMFDPRNPDRVIFSIADSMGSGHVQHEVFKLPTYTEALAPSDSEESAQPPAYVNDKPPEYQP